MLNDIILAKNAQREVNIFYSLKGLHDAFPTSPRGALSFCVKGAYLSSDQNVTLSLFQYIFMNPERYGFQSIVNSDNRSGCFLTSNRPDFREGAPLAKEAESSFVFTLMIYPSRNHDDPRNFSGDSAPFLKYYLLIMNSSNKYEEDPSAKSKDSHSEYISSGYYLKDIVKNAEKRMSFLLEKALRFYGRDSLWKQLLHNSAAVLESAEWTRLFLERIAPNSRSLLAIDSSLSNVLGRSHLDWDAILNHLQTRYPTSTRSLRDGSTRQHLVIFNEENSDYLMHIVVERQPIGEEPLPAPSTSLLDLGGLIDMELQSHFVVSASIVSREGVPDEVEWKQVDEVVNQILCWIVNETRRSVAA